VAATYFILKAGIAPPDLAKQPEAIRLMFWGWVVEAGLRAKDRELAAGINASGGKLPPVRPVTRKHRRSAMTASGRGDRNAPYLMPGRGLSRTRSLLTGKPHRDHAEFWWAYDPWTGDTWGKILSYHAKRGEAYDVIGLSPRGVSAVAKEARSKWERWKSGRLTLPMPAVQSRAPAAQLRVVGRTDLQNMTLQSGDESRLREAIDEGRFSGFMSADEWKKHWRSKAPAVRLRSEVVTPLPVRQGKSNVLLQHTWGDYQPASKVLPMNATRLDRAVNTLVETLRTMPDLTPEQLIAVVGDAEMFGQAVTQALVKRLIVIGKGEDGRLYLRVVG
jgi:hypothetical protein